MIVFDLRCGAGHVFEAWFGSGAAYDAQAAGGLVACPVCGDTCVEKGIMAPRVGAKGNAAPAPGELARAKAMMARLAAAQGEALKGSTWVGDGFARAARAMHEGEAPHAPIHGRASLADARSLADDGVPVAPLPLPVVPPEERN